MSMTITTYTNWTEPETGLLRLYFTEDHRFTMYAFDQLGVPTGHAEGEVDGTNLRDAMRFFGFRHDVTKWVHNETHWVASVASDTVEFLPAIDADLKGWLDSRNGNGDLDIREFHQEDPECKYNLPFSGSGTIVLDDKEDPRWFEAPEVTPDEDEEEEEGFLW